MFKIRKSVLNYNEYYLYFIDSNDAADDQAIADILGIELIDYREFIKRKFNAVYRRAYDMMYFLTEQDAEAALQYVNEHIN